MRLVGLAGVMAGTWLVLLHAHACAPPACAPRACAPDDAVVATAPVPAAISPAPAAAGPAPAAAGPAPAAATADSPEPPTVTLPCADSTTELLVADHRPVLCWDDRCLVYRDDATASVPRPDSPEREPEAAVGTELACTGARCDRLGPKLRDRIAGVDPSSLSATRDHAAILIEGGSSRFELWNRAADRPVGLGKPRPDDGEMERVDVLGNDFMVTSPCNEYCSDGAFLIDAHGRRHGPGFARKPRWGGPPNDVVAVDADLFVVFGGFGEIAMISHGRRVATAEFLPANTTQPIQVTVQAVALDHEAVAAEWCTAKTCHLTRIFLGGTDPDSKRSYIDLSEDTPLPSCSR